MIFVCFVVGFSFLVSCNRPDVVLSDEESVKQGLKDLAPKGGTGVKEYDYPSGELMQRFYWKDFAVDKVEYFLKNGEMIHIAHPLDGHTISVEMSEEGSIDAIYEAKHFVKDGTLFKFSNGRLSAIETWDFGERVHVLPVDKSTGYAVSNEQ